MQWEKRAALPWIRKAHGRFQFSLILILTLTWPYQYRPLKPWVTSEVKRKSLFYHLVDSMLVESAFHGLKGNRFLRAEISQPNLQTVQEGPRPDVMELENGRVLNMHHLLGLPANETSPQKKGSGAPLSTALGKKQRDSGGSDPIQSKFAHLITKKTGLGELFKIAREQQKVDREKLDQFMATESPSVDIVLETQESQIELVHPEQNNEQEVAASPPSGTMNGRDKLLKDSPANAITATKSCPDINPNSSGKHNSCSLVQNPVHSSVQLKTADNGIPHVKQIEPNFKKAAKIEPQTNSSGKRKRAR